MCHTVKRLSSRALYLANFDRNLYKTAKLKGANTDTIPTLIDILHVLELCGLNSAK